MEGEQVVDGLPVVAFTGAGELRAWLEAHAGESPGVWVRVAKAASRIPSVTFLELLDAGLCFGWSESSRRTFDSGSYLQRFTPRRTRGTASPRNRERARLLIASGLMTDRGLAALDLPPERPVSPCG